MAHALSAKFVYLFGGSSFFYSALVRELAFLEADCERILFLEFILPLRSGFFAMLLPLCYFSAGFGMFAGLLGSYLDLLGAGDAIFSSCS